jgi:septum formation protein
VTPVPTALPRPLILASGSPRRSDLLRQRGYTFEVIPAEVTESDASSPEQTVLANACRKAAAVARLRSDALVLGVDTIVAFSGRIFGKPSDLDHAFRMLSELNGQMHQVYSGVCLAWDGGASLHTFVETTTVHFHQRTDEELRAYLTRIAPLDKAGAYAAQDDASGMIAKVEGSFSNVVGLPMESLARAFTALS